MLNAVMVHPDKREVKRKYSTISTTKFEDFKKATLGFFKDIEQFKDELSTLLTHNFNILDAKLT